MSSESLNTETNTGRKLTKKEIKILKSLDLSLAQEQEIRQIWANEQDQLRGIGSTIIVNLLKLLAIGALIANVWYKNPTTILADNLVVAATILVSLLLLIGSAIYYSITDSNNKKLVFSHAGILLLVESGFFEKTYGKITNIIFILLFLGSGHIYVGIFLIVVSLMVTVTSYQAKETVKKKLEAIV